jgi:hypothetical protein
LYEDEDDAVPSRGRVERGRVMVITIATIQLVTAVVHLLLLFILGMAHALPFQGCDAGRQVAFMYGAIGAIILRASGAFGLLARRNSARISLGVLLVLMGAFNVFVFVSGNYLAIIDAVMNLGIGITLLVSPSIAAYTDDSVVE